MLDLSTHGEATNGEVVRIYFVLLNMHVTESNHYFVGKQLNRKSCLESIRLCRNRVSLSLTGLLVPVCLIKSPPRPETSWKVDYDNYLDEGHTVDPVC